MKVPYSSHPSHRWNQILLSLILIASLLTSCQLPWKTGSEIGTEEPGLAEVHESGISTAEPRKDLPPDLVEISPVPNSQINLQQPISMYFNQPMDTGSVEAAIHFEPAISGRFAWDNSQTLTFTPDQMLTAGSPLRLVINTSAQAVNKKKFQNPVEVNFYTADNLQLTQSVPPDGAEEVDPESAVFVSFNQPVVPLGAEEDSDPAFTLSPEVTGNGTWINTSTYLFRPDPTMEGGTSYRILLNESLTATSGATYDSSQELEIQFATTLPEVLNILPLSNARLSLDGPIELQFNVRMDPDSVEENFLLRSAEGLTVSGSFEWAENYKSFSFTPNTLLNRRSGYTIQLSAEAESYGGIPLNSEFQAVRSTYPDFSIAPSVAPQFESYYAQFGSYQIQFTTPLNNKNYQDAISISPDVGLQSSYLSNENTTMFITGYFAPETQYSLTIDGSLTDTWGEQLGERLVFSFFTPPVEPSLNLVSGANAYNLIFVPASESEAVIQATNITILDLELSPISIDDLVTLLHPDNYDYRQVFLPDNLEKSTQILNLPRNASQVVRVPLSYQNNDLTPGIYFLRLSSPDIPDDDYRSSQRLFLIVSENNLVFKVAPEQAMVWATRLNDYSPLANTPVLVYDTEGEILARGQTDSDGLFKAGFEKPESTYASYFTLVGEPGEPDFSFSISAWGDWHGLYEMGIPFDFWPVSMGAYIYTDRPIYRPGDTVNFRAAIYSRDNGIPSSAELDSVTVSVFSDSGMSGVPQTLYSKELTLSQFGTVKDSVLLPENAPVGYYRIELTSNEDVIESYYFDVAAYRKPTIELAVDLSQNEVITNQDLSAAIQADYYFGMPVTDGTFSWTAFMKEEYFSLPGYRVGPLSTEWLIPGIFDGYSPLGEMVASGNGKTDEAGLANVILPADDLSRSTPVEGIAHILNLEVTFIDESGFPVSFRDSAIIHPENFYIGVQPESYAGRENTPMGFSIQTVDWDKAPIGNMPVEATFEAIEWEVEETLSMEMPYRYIPVTTLIASATPVTDEEGLARVSFTPPEPGTYQLTLKSNNAITQVLVWVSGEGSAVWPLQPQNRVTLTPDLEEYQPGQIAQLFFPNPFPEGAKALISIERGQVMETQVIDISGNGHTLSVPVTQESIPNIFISLILLGKDEDGLPDFRQGIYNLQVAPISKTLRVDLTLDPTRTEPGKQVSALLSIKDAQGNPVQGEFSVAVVDKALLALVPPNSMPIVDAFYGVQPLSVQTSLSLKTFAHQLTLTALDLGLGGGSDMETQLSLREDFPDTAFWQANVVTGADGTARLSIPLPDSLTTWVVDVRGLTEDYLIGQTEAEILTQKDLMIQPITPRFLVDGDIVEMAATVHNNTAQVLDVDVSLLGNGFTLQDETQQTQQGSIRAGGRERFTWMGEVESVDQVNLVFQVISGPFTDASTPVWGDLEVLRYALPQTFSTSGQLTEESQRMELISLPVSTDPSSGTLSLELTPSLTATLVEGLQTLETNPDSDTISVLSRLLANLNAYLALNKLGINSPQLEANLARLVDEGIHALLEAQNYDGGWSWWGRVNDDREVSDTFTTTYVLLGLDQASEAGIEINDHFLDRAGEFLQNQLDDPATLGSGSELDRLTFQVYALRNRPISLTMYLESLYSRRSDLSPWSLALLALTIEAVDGQNARVRTLLTDLESEAVRSATGVHWESGQVFWSLPGTPVFNTAVAIFALSQLDPASTSLPFALRYLLSYRNAEGMWSSTFESAWSLMAITEALKGTGDYQADYDFKAMLNDTLIAEGTDGGTAPLSSVTTNISMENLHPSSPNALVIERGPGAGTLYYRADLRTFQPATSARAINRGIIIQREFYIAGEGCPGAEGCLPIDTLILDPEDPAQAITVTITVVISQDLYHFMLEDFIPSGTEILNRGFLTSQTLVEDHALIEDPLMPYKDGWGWWYFAAPQIFDDHLLWTADFLPAGTYSLSYDLIPLQRGIFQVLPARAWQYFFPEVQGTSAGDLFTIQ